MTVAHGSPFLVILRWIEVISPATTTVALCGRSSSVTSWPIVQSVPLDSTCSNPSSGWSET